MLVFLLFILRSYTLIQFARAPQLLLSTRYCAQWSYSHRSLNGRNLSSLPSGFPCSLGTFRGMVFALPALLQLRLQGWGTGNRHVYYDVVLLGMRLVAAGELAVVDDHCENLGLRPPTQRISWDADLFFNGQVLLSRQDTSLNKWLRFPSQMKWV